MNKIQQAGSITLKKVPTGIVGFDEITGGGLPFGRPTLVCGDAGCGKTLFSMEFLVRGAVQFNEPGVFMSFEETENELVTNVASLGFNLHDLINMKKVMLDHVQIERSEIEETGEFDLQALFIRLDHAINTLKAKRLVLDTIESLFSGFPNPAILRAEIRRLFRWLKEKKLTVVITGEAGGGSYTRQGIEEYVSDCVIKLDHRIIDQVSTRRLRVVKYRGSLHGTNEYPFLINSDGISVFPITSLKLDYNVSDERISSGIPEMDNMLGGKGFYRESTILVSGSPGTGKSSVCAHIANAGCQRGERVLYFAYEESPDQILRNMRSIGIHLEQWIKKGLLRFNATRPTYYGLEMHLAIILKDINYYKPHIVIVDPLNSFATKSNVLEAESLSIKLFDFLKSKKITGLFTILSSDQKTEQAALFISSLIDTWIILRYAELNAESTRGLQVLKSRGMAHSNRIRDFLITDKGIQFNKHNIDQDYTNKIQKAEGTSAERASR